MSNPIPLWESDPQLAAHCELVDLSASVLLMLREARKQRMPHFVAKLETVLEQTDRVKSYLKAQARANSKGESTDDNSRS